jgi:hypothetical protein
VRANVRAAIAHFASPWQWRSKLAVQVLVASMAAVPLLVVMVGIGRVVNGQSLVGLVGTGLETLLAYLLLTRPALRSFRRWEDRHAGDSTAAGA